METTRYKTKNTGAVFTICSCLIFYACVKNQNPPLSTDELVYKDVKGMVFNTCTDSGIAGITVYLEIYYKQKRINKYQTVSGVNGEYLFKSAELRTDPQYNYGIYIPSKGGDYAKDFETCGIRGTSISFGLDEAETFMKPSVVPKMIYINFYFPRKQTSTALDSIQAKFTQDTYHKNVPDYPFSFTPGASGNSKTGFEGGIGNYPSGLYNIIVDEWKGGIHKQWKETIYTKYGDTACYVRPW